jgi:hypothetical protein
MSKARMDYIPTLTSCQSNLGTPIFERERKEREEKNQEENKQHILNTTIMSNTRRDDVFSLFFFPKQPANPYFLMGQRIERKKKEKKKRKKRGE